MAKTKTYTLFLLKEEVVEFPSVFSETALAQISAKKVTEIKSSEFGERAVVYIFKNEPKVPAWLADIRTEFSSVPTLTNKSSSAVVVFETAGRVFAATFAHGWQYLDDTKIETDFGLKVTINSLADDNVKRIDSDHLGEAMKGVSQSAFQRPFGAFGIDDALELVKKVTGNGGDDTFASSLSGSTSLKVSKKMTFQELPALAEIALERSQSTKYTKSAFAIIDKVRPVSDKVLIEALDSAAVERIKAGDNNFELSMPGWSENEVVYFGFYGLWKSQRLPDLLMKNYQEALGENIDSLDVETIRDRHGVFAEFNSESTHKKRWSIKRALVGSQLFNGGLYSINEGAWFRLDEQFKESVETSFESLKEDWEEAPLKIVKKISLDGKRSGLESELDYNLRCAKHYDQVCLDQKLIHLTSESISKFEACDLLDIPGKKLIHVKKGARQSSVLSHFFKQGSNSARILKQYPEAIPKLIERVRQVAGEEVAGRLRASMTEGMSNWKVEYHIIDAPKDGVFQIPFFSRITLREEVRMLKSMSLDVGIKFIPT